MKNITIYRDSWLHSEGDMRSMLLRPEDNKMCCLGQLGYQCGVPLNELSDRISLAEHSLYAFADKFPAFVRKIYNSSGRCITINSDLANKAMLTNDGRTEGYHGDIEVLPQLEQEAKITSLLAKAGFEVTFVDGIAPWFAENADGDQNS